MLRDALIGSGGAVVIMLLYAAVARFGGCGQGEGENCGSCGFDGRRSCRENGSTTQKES
jgi:hypothetical protein